MITVRESISLVKSGMKEVHADSRKTNKEIYSRLSNKIIVLIQRESDTLKLGYIDELYQPLKCIKIEEAPTIDDCCGIKSKAKIYRSVNKIPDIYTDSRGPIVQYLESIDSNLGPKRIILSSPQDMKRMLEDTYSKYDKNIYAFLNDDYLYMLKKVPVTMKAAFIQDVSSINDCSCEDKPCTRFLDTLWRVPKKLVDTAVQLVIQDLAPYENKQEQIRIDKNPNK